MLSLFDIFVRLWRSIIFYHLVQVDHEVPNILCDAGNIGNLLGTIICHPEILQFPSFSVILHIAHALKYFPVALEELDV